MSYFLGLDVSTTATKALLIDGEGVVVAIGRAEYGYETPRPLWSEQDPELWWQGTVAAIAEALAEAGVEGSDVAGVGLTGQMHGLVLLDAQRAACCGPRFCGTTSARAPSAMRYGRSSGGSG